jgi:hypothetical protein
MIDNELINNRPKELIKIQYYTKLPEDGFRIKYDSLPSYLNMDLYTLCGILPKTLELIEYVKQFGFDVQPSEKEVEYYRNKNTKFQIINVVANIHTFKKDNNNNVFAYPYSISLVAGPKRGIPDVCSIDFINSFNIEEFSQNQQGMFTDFSPFKPIQTGFFTFGELFLDPKVERNTDTIGFVLESFFLPTDTNIEIDRIPMPGPQLDKLINEKYNKYRVKRYYKPFTNLIPRKIWGCDSPIELFLIQALASKDLFPIIQTLIFRNGHVYDNFYDMVKNKIFIKGDELITEADLYFPKNKLAIFCDSSQFHRGKKNKNKDELIDIELSNIGIITLRFSGKEIIEDINSCVNKVLELIK